MLKVVSLLGLFGATHGINCHVLNSKRAGNQGATVTYEKIGNDKLRVTMSAYADWVSWGMPKPGSVHMNLGNFIIGDAVNGIVYDSLLSQDWDAKPDIWDGEHGFIRGTEEISMKDGVTTLQFDRLLAPDHELYHPVPAEGSFDYIWAYGDVDDSKEGPDSVLYHRKDGRGHPAADLSQESSCQLAYDNCYKLKSKRAGDQGHRLYWTVNPVREGFENLQSVSFKLEANSVDRWVSLGFPSPGVHDMTDGDFVTGYLTGSGMGVVEDQTSMYNGKPSPIGENGFLQSSVEQDGDTTVLEFIRWVAPEGRNVINLDGEAIILWATGDMMSGDQSYHFKENRGHPYIDLLQASTCDGEEESESEEPHSSHEEMAEEPHSSHEEMEDEVSGCKTAAQSFLVRARGMKNKCLTATPQGPKFRVCKPNMADKQTFTFPAGDGGHMVQMGGKCLLKNGSFGDCSDALVVQLNYNAKSNSHSLKAGKQCIAAAKQGIKMEKCGKGKLQKMLLVPTFEG